MLATNKKRNDYQFENTVGRMDRRITIMQPIVSDGDSNEDKVTGYELVDTNPEVWARVVNDTGDTVMVQDQAKHMQQSVFIIRYRDDITIKHKVVHNGKMYSVLSAIEFGEQRKQRTKITGEYLKDYVIT